MSITNKEAVAIAETLSIQFRALAPSRLQFRGHVYIREELATCDKDGTTTFSYARQGSLTRLYITINYVRRMDEYGVTIRFADFDSDTFSFDTIQEFEGVHWEMFRDVAQWLTL